MSASEKQIAANRLNAKKSTGPKTVSGKQKASRNATTHGAFLCAAHVPMCQRILGQVETPAAHKPDRPGREDVGALFIFAQNEPNC